MSVDTITPNDLYEIIKKDPQTLVIDVRTLEEFADCHIINAKSLPLADIATKEEAFAQISQLRKNPQQAIYVTCATGRRAALACSQLTEANISGLCLVEGGTKAWVEEGLPVNSLN